MGLKVWIHEFIYDMQYILQLEIIFIFYMLHNKEFNNYMLLSSNLSSVNISH